jgi:hypothetical protein
MSRAVLPVSVEFTSITPALLSAKNPTVPFCVLTTRA